MASADAAAFLLLQSAVVWVRDRAWLGSGVAGVTRDMLPEGYLGGWRFLVALIIGLLVAGNYGQGDRRRDSARLLLGVCIATSLSLWAQLWVFGVAKVVVQFATTGGAFWLTLVGARRVIDWLVGRYRTRTGQAERVLFVGDPQDPMSAQIHSRLVRDGMVSLGWVVCANGKGKAGRLGAGTGSEIVKVRQRDDIWLALQGKQADIVVLAGHLPESLFEEAVDASAAAGCRTLLVPHFDGTSRLRTGVARYHGLQFVELTVPGLAVPHLLVKRCVDMIGSIIALVLLAPLMGLIAIAVKLNSPGPVLFRQDRVGLGGRIFQVLKFRTMRAGADEEKASLAHLNHTGDPRLFKIPNDPRITPVGAWLRRWSLDELPQLWNVLVGDMSLVGPRPFPESDLGGYQDHHFLRLSVKPGITGLWQVNGRSDIVDFEEVVRLDREYVERWSVWLDLAIIFQTFPAVFRRSGAY